MNEPLDEAFFIWLYNRVADSSVKAPSRSYWKLLRVLYTKEFTWIVPNDDNRLEDGKQLRMAFVREAHIQDVDQDWIELGCSMFELMVGLSDRLAFEAGGEPHYWFWHLMENLDIRGYTDDRRVPKKRIEDILDRVIWRTYDRNGQGGFFPLKGRCDDQRKIELWYQLSSYVLEME